MPLASNRIWEAGRCRRAGIQSPSRWERHEKEQVRRTRTRPDGVAVGSAMTECLQCRTTMVAVSTMCPRCRYTSTSRISREPMTTCPECRAEMLAVEEACPRCSPVSLQIPASKTRVTRWDIGKPLGTPHQVSGVCPCCGSVEHKKVKPAAMVAFAQDRICLACGSRYTPPTPAWARGVFALIGIGFLGLGGWGQYASIAESKWRTAASFAALFILGCGCLYKAATK
jgi:hypothetical protein